MGTLAKGTVTAHILDDRGGVTMGDCQVRLAGCQAMGRSAASVVRVLWMQDGRPIRVCSACREAKVGSGSWLVRQQPRRAWVDPAGC